MSILAIDQGTTSTRAYLVGPDGLGRIVHSVAHSNHHPAPGHVEQDVSELLANIRACIAVARGLGQVRAMGIDNQGESCLGWDAATGEPVGPVIVWQDDRTKDTLAGMADVANVVTAKTGLPLDPYFSGSKLGLIAKGPKAQKLLAKGRLRLGTTDAYFRDQLTGRFETDPTTASRTALFNLETCRWDADLCDLFGVPMNCLPTIRPTTGDLGKIDGIPLTASIVDQQAALFGHGCRRAGDAKITFGTGAFALVVSGQTRPKAPTGILPTIAWQQQGDAVTYALDGGVTAASSAVNWARGLGLFDRYDQINHFAAPPAISRGLIFVPALSGLAAPHWDRAARGAWLGMDHGTTPADLMQALLEGIALRMAEVLTAVEAAQPLGNRISIDGGLSTNPYFAQFLADVTGRDIAVASNPELSAQGTAQLAGIAVGIGLPEVAPGSVFRPDVVPSGWVERFKAGRNAIQTYGNAARATAP